MVLHMQEDEKNSALRAADDAALAQQRDAVTRALEQHVPAHELEAAHAATAQAEGRVTQLQAANEELAAQSDVLSAELARTHGEAASLQDVRETSEGAIASLEETLLKIEKQVARGRSGGMAQEDVQLASLSRQIVNAKLAEADAQRKLRVAARQELDHWQRIATQTERIGELKEAVAELRRELAQQRSAASAHQRARTQSAGAEKRGRETTRPPAAPRRQSARPRVSFDDESPDQGYPVRTL